MLQTILYVLKKYKDLKNKKGQGNKKKKKKKWWVWLVIAQLIIPILAVSILWMSDDEETDPDKMPYYWYDGEEQDYSEADLGSRDKPFSSVLENLGDINNSTLAGEILEAHTIASKGTYSKAHNKGRTVPIEMLLGIHVTEVSRYTENILLPKAGIPYDEYGKPRGDGSKQNVKSWTYLDHENFYPTIHQPTSPYVSSTGARGPMQWQPASWGGSDGNWKDTRRGGSRFDDILNYDFYSEELDWGRRRNANGDNLYDPYNLYDASTATSDWYRDEVFGDGNSSTKSIEERFGVHTSEVEVASILFGGSYVSGASGYRGYFKHDESIMKWYADEVRNMIKDEDFVNALLEGYATKSHGNWDLELIWQAYRDNGWTVSGSGNTARPSKNGITLPTNGAMYGFRAYYQGLALLPFLQEQAIIKTPVKDTSGLVYYAVEANPSANLEAIKTTRGHILEIGYHDAFPIYYQSDNSIYGSTTYYYDKGIPKSFASSGCPVFAITSLLQGMGYSNTTFPSGVNLDLDGDGYWTPLELWNSGALGNWVNPSKKTSGFPYINSGVGIRNGLGLDVVVRMRDSATDVEAMRQDLLNGKPYVIQLHKDQSNKMYTNEEGVKRKLIYSSTHFVVAKDAFVKNGKTYVRLINSTNGTDKNSFNSNREAYLFDDLVKKTSTTNYGNFTLANWGPNKFDSKTPAQKTPELPQEETTIGNVVEGNLFNIGYNEKVSAGYTYRELQTEANQLLKSPYDAVVIYATTDVVRLAVSQTQFIEIRAITHTLSRGSYVGKDANIGRARGANTNMYFGYINSDDSITYYYWLSDEASTWGE